MIPRIGPPSGKEIISAFVNRIASRHTQLVTFAASFDLPVLCYRAMVCRVALPGLALRDRACPVSSSSPQTSPCPVQRAERECLASDQNTEMLQRDARFTWVFNDSPVVWWHNINERVNRKDRDR
jgi:hypothetical protein